MSYMGELSSESAVYRTLLETTKAIPWKIDWATMTFAYIGPQIEALLGWSPESWMTVEDWATRMHPDDREQVVNFCVAQSQAGVDHEADYRALTKDNGYVWIRDVVHVVRNERGEVEALIGFMFDITERKKTEEKLIALQKELEALSFKDGLTNIANRRRFDVSLELEWASARSNGQPLSILLFDIDFFQAIQRSLRACAGRQSPDRDCANAEPGAGWPARRGCALWWRRVCCAVAASGCLGGTESCRTLPAADSKASHHPRAITAGSARHRQHWRWHRHARRPHETLQLHRGSGPAALCGQEKRQKPDRDGSGVGLNATARCMPQWRAEVNLAGGHGRCVCRPGRDGRACAGRGALRSF